MDKLKSLTEEDKLCLHDDVDDVDVESAKDKPSRTTSEASEALQRHRRAQAASHSQLYNLRHHPLLLVAPTLCFIVATALCVFGLTWATDKRIETERQLTKVSTIDTADALSLQLSVASSAALTLATFVRVDPNWDTLEAQFLTVSKEIFRQANETGTYDLAELAYAPFGKVAANYAPPDRDRGPVRTDLFAPEYVNRTKPFATVKLGAMDIAGPLTLTHGGRTALIARYPVFIENVTRDEDWSNPFNQTAPTGCEELCYDEATMTKFWGFTTAFFYADALVSGEDDRLRQLIQEGYEYRLTKQKGDDSRKLIVQSKGWSGDLKATAEVEVKIPGSSWYLASYNPEIDDIVLLVMLLVSNKRAALLLREQMASNEALEEANEHLIRTKHVLEKEKQQRETLLGRQFDLISCFERKDSKRSNVPTSVATKQLATLEQIAALRRAMEEERREQGAHASDDLCFLEMLGEGTFGKVHRSLWRSTVVAIKTIMLPANMSGAEKREKMVIWEAAISSSLTHPNIVQTYTYSIKPVREQDRGFMGGNSFCMSGLGSAVQICGNLESPHHGNAHTVQSSDKSTEGGHIHSFQVSLVLEYCDRGCLRDALDQGAFMTEGGLNYAAILDSAEDVASAMLHLHCNNILHMDLKTRNILLASTGTEGRGVTCKASDFGLAVRMEQMETHMSNCFQGTLTHMAPEILLKGQVSKAADVYAFGIVLWELFTGGQPYKGVPKALLGHKVVAENVRPPLPFVMPQAYQSLVKACWSANPEKRPSFAEILDRLRALRESVPGPTDPLGPITRPLPKLPGSRGTASPRQLAASEASATTRGATPTRQLSPASTLRHEGGRVTVTNPLHVHEQPPRASAPPQLSPLSTLTHKRGPARLHEHTHELPLRSLPPLPLPPASALPSAFKGGGTSASSAQRAPHSPSRSADSPAVGAPAGCAVTAPNGTHVTPTTPTESGRNVGVDALALSVEQSEASEAGSGQSSPRKPRKMVHHPSNSATVSWDTTHKKANPARHAFPAQTMPRVPVAQTHHATKRAGMLRKTCRTKCTIVTLGFNAQETSHVLKATQ